jgi:hypothetical protein
MPTGFHAGVYSSVAHYLKAVKATGTDDAPTLRAASLDYGLRRALRQIVGINCPLDRERGAGLAVEVRRGRAVNRRGVPTPIGKLNY